MGMVSVFPTPTASGLTSIVTGFNESGEAVQIPVVAERPMTIFLNSKEVVTTMTLGDFPSYLAVGFLSNQRMLDSDNPITAIDCDDDLGVIVVRTKNETDFEAKLVSRVRTSGCAQGTVFGDVMEQFEQVRLNEKSRISVLKMQNLIKTINMMPSLYLEAGAIHGCVLAQEDIPLAYIEDVGRHNAVDKIAGWMVLNDVAGDDKVFYTTGRLTSEMVIKTVMMGIPILISRSGFTESGVDLARKVGLTLIGRARGKRFTVLSGHERVIYDADDKSDDDIERLSPQRQQTGDRR